MYDQITLPNGLRIIGEYIPHFHSVSLGIWLGAGSVYESPTQGGISHLIEHMVFKGTKKRTARQISEEMDAVGGQLNAFTCKDCTCFYVKVLDEHFRLGMDVVCDLVTAPKFDAVELEKEKGVVLEEISMAEDTPEDVSGELLMLAMYGDQPVSRPILGTEESVTGFSRDDLLEYYNAMYRPENAVFALAGNYDWNTVLALADEFLGAWEKGNFVPVKAVTNPVPPTNLRRKKDIEQVHISLGYPALNQYDKRNYALALLNNAFGGATSSRLFQRIREEKGLAYSVYSYPGSYADCGVLTVYAGTSPENAELVGELLREEAALLAENGLTEDEFRMGKEQLKASLILGSESNSARMHSIGRRMLIFGDTRTDDEIIQRLNAITLEEINHLAYEIFSQPCAEAIVGND